MALNLQVNDSYKYVAFLSSNQGADGLPTLLDPGLKKLIYSDQINHELVSMMFGKNILGDIEHHENSELNHYNEVNSDAIIPAQLDYEDLDEDLISILSQIGFFQIYTKSPIDKYEFSTLLNSINLTAILIPQSDNDKLEATILHFQNDDEYSYYKGVNLDISSLTRSNRLLLITKSSTEVKELSQEIHNNMIYPHNNIEEYVLFDYDLSKYMSASVIDTNLFDRESQIQLGNISALYQFTKTGDNEYVNSLYDNIKGKYLININNQQLDYE